MLKRVAVAIGIVLASLAAGLIVFFVVSAAAGDAALISTFAAWAVICGLLVVPAYPPSERRAWRFALWAFAGLVLALLPVAYLAVRVAWRRTPPLEARTPA
jgi:Na+/melibiose symporter-like transporter